MRTQYIPGLVSVVIPTYNGSLFIREAIDGALAQTYAELEVVVVDDGSSDGTREVCLGYKEKVRYIYQDNDRTLGAGARSRAILESRGEWVALLDHDDRWLATKIEEQVAEIEPDERVGVVFTGARMIGEDGRETGEFFAKGPCGDVFHQLLAGARYCASSALVRRAAIDRARIRGPHGDFLANPAPWNCDIDLWMKISRSARILFLDKPLTEYRTHRSNVSRDTAWLLALQLQALEATRTDLHPGCWRCLKCYRAGRRALQKRLALAHFDKFIGHTVRGEKSWVSLADALRADVPLIFNPRRFGVMVKYLLLSMMNSSGAGCDASAGGPG